MYPLKEYDQVIYYYYQEVQAKRKHICMSTVDLTEKSFTSGGPLNE